GFYAVTSFWHTKAPGEETQYGINQIEAAKEAGVKHVIWSTLPNATKLSNNKYNVPQFTQKAEVDQAVLEGGFQFYTFVAVGFYFQNFQFYFPPKEEDGTLVFTLPVAGDKRLWTLDVEDLGEAVVNVLNDPEKWSGKYVPVYRDNLRLEDYFKV